LNEVVITTFHELSLTKQTTQKQQIYIYIGNRKRGGKGGGEGGGGREEGGREERKGGKTFN